MSDNKEYVGKTATRGPEFDGELLNIAGSILKQIRRVHSILDEFGSEVDEEELKSKLSDSETMLRDSWKSEIKTPK